ncbi:MAG: hypothetical protein P0S95_04950 [Rhabdochlamydiaceae bacterium]|nr:hypothetical protein [Candidatus Amphrikana amoebophyrae]
MSVKEILGGDSSSVVVTKPTVSSKELINSAVNLLNEGGALPTLKGFLVSDLLSILSHKELKASGVKRLFNLLPPEIRHSILEEVGIREWGSMSYPSRAVWSVKHLKTSNPIQSMQLGERALDEGRFIPLFKELIIQYSSTPGGINKDYALIERKTFDLEDRVQSLVSHIVTDGVSILLNRNAFETAYASSDGSMTLPWLMVFDLEDIPKELHITSDKDPRLSDDKFLRSWYNWISANKAPGCRLENFEAVKQYLSICIKTLHDPEWKPMRDFILMHEFAHIHSAHTHDNNVLGLNLIGNVSHSLKCEREADEIAVKILGTAKPAVRFFEKLGDALPFAINILQKFTHYTPTERAKYLKSLDLTSLSDVRIRRIPIGSKRIDI